MWRPESPLPSQPLQAFRVRCGPELLFPFHLPRSSPSLSRCPRSAAPERGQTESPSGGQEAEHAACPSLTGVSLPTSLAILRSGVTTVQGTEHPIQGR